MPYSNNERIKFRINTSTSNTTSLPLILPTCSTAYNVKHSGNLTNPKVRISDIGDIFFALDEKENLLTFNNNLFVESRPIIGINPVQTALAIDFRPNNNRLYLLANGPTGAQLYMLNIANSCQVTATTIGGILMTATNDVIRFVGKASIDFNPVADRFLGRASIDFNTVADRLRIVTTSGQNFRVNPDTGITIIDGDLKIVSTTITPRISGIAYTNSVLGSLTTTLYGINTRDNTLVTINPPNIGTVNVVGPLGVNFSEVQGFDIQGGTNIAIAILVVCCVSKFYSINLTTGQATELGKFKNFRAPIKDFAIAYIPVTGPINLEITLLNNNEPIYTSEPKTISVVNPAQLLVNPQSIVNNYYYYYHNNHFCHYVQKNDILTATISSTNDQNVPAYIYASLSVEIKDCKKHCC